MAHDPTNQWPVLSIFTSKGDWATRYAFPIGRFFSTIFQRNRDSRRKAANREAIGWFQPFITHDLLYNSTAASESKGAGAFNPDTGRHELHPPGKLRVSAENIAEQREKWLPIATTPEVCCLDDATLRPRTGFRPGDPLLIVAVDKKIMKDHDDIANPVIINFLREFIQFCQSAP